MRFLLNSLRNAKNVHRNPPAARRIEAIGSCNGEDQTSIWSQQCGANCGCLLRLHIDIDHGTQTIKGAEYHSKALLLEKRAVAKETKKELNEDGSWSEKIITQYEVVPVRTTRNNRPLVAGCNCKTLKQLANAVCSYLPSRTISELRNSVEYSSIRSSTSFRSHILQQVDRKNSSLSGHCFDLVEEAFLTLLKGYEPQPRRQEGQITKHHSRGAGRVQFNRKKSISNLSTVDDEYLDWLSFVDEEEQSSVY